jgi:predicted RNA binding protein YcfA (HicA-like mRNA interferase family)
VDAAPEDAPGSVAASARSRYVRMLEEDGWILASTSGSHRHFRHPTKPGLVTVAGKPAAP